MKKFTRGQKITIGLGILAFCGVIIAALINHSNGQPSQSLYQSISNGNDNIQAGGNVNVQTSTYNNYGNMQVGNSNTMNNYTGEDITTNKDFQTLETQLHEALGQLNTVNNELIETRNATSPRRINTKQRNMFILLLSDKQVSKTYLPVVVGNNDSETENFAAQFRDMLNVAGYGKDAPLSLPPPSKDYIWVTNQIYTPVPPAGTNDYADVIVRPGLCPFSPTNNDVDVLVLINTNSFSPSIFSSLMIFKSFHDQLGTEFAFRPTNDPNAIALGVCQALIEEGISVGLMPANGILPDGQTGFFIPQKIY